MPRPSHVAFLCLGSSAFVESVSRFGMEAPTMRESLIAPGGSMGTLCRVAGPVNPPDGPCPRTPLALMVITLCTDTGGTFVMADFEGFKFSCE